jgi:hypothetical protein
MSSRGARVVLVGLLAVVVLSFAAPSYADGLQDCLNQGTSADGSPVTCIDNGDGTYSPVSGSNDDGGGVPGWFIGAGILVVLLGIGGAAWRVSTARQMATDAGMDPDTATKMALFTNNGLDATYLAASLKQPAHESEPATSPSKPGASDRLTELKSLLDGGQITQAEYDERRQAIINDV